MSLEYATLIFLVAVFFAAEAYRILRGKRGIVLSMDLGNMGESALVGVRALILMENGTEITADIPACTICIGRLSVGTEVRVTSSERGYLVDIPWYRRLS